jgi:hypothetical protein
MNSHPHRPIPPIRGRCHRLRAALAILLGLALAAPVAAAEFLKTWVPQRFMETEEVLMRSAASPEGRMLAIQQKGGSIRLVDLEKRETVKVLPKVADGITCLALGNNGDVLAVGAGKAVYVVDLAKDEAPRRIFSGGSSINRVALFSPRGLVAVASADGLRVLRQTSGDTVFSNTENPCLSLAFSPDGQTLAATQGKVVTLYDLPNVIQRWRLALNYFPACLAFSEDASLLAVGGASETVVLAAVKDGQVQRKLELGHSASRLQDLVLTPDAKGLVATSGARVWVVDDLTAGAPPMRDIKLDDRITSLVLSSRAQTLMVSTEDTRFLTVFATSLKLPEHMVMDFKPKPQIKIFQPVVEILSPATETLVKGETIQVLARVKASAEQKLQSLRVLVDGRPVSAAGGPLPRATPLPPGAQPLGADEELYQFTVPVPGQDCTVAMLGETLYATSKLAALKLRREAPAPVPVVKPAFRIIQPEVTIVSPPAETMVQGDAAQLILKVRSAAEQKFQSVRILVDGRQVEAVGGMRPKAAAQDLGVQPLLSDEELLLYSVPLPNRDCTVAVLAETAFADSAPAAVRLRRQPPAPVKPAPPAVITIIRPTVEILSPRSGEVAKFDVVNLMVKIAASPEQKVTDLKVQVDGQSVAVLGDLATQAAAMAAPAPGRVPGQLAAPPLLEEIRQVSVPIPARHCTITVWAETAYANSDIASLRVRREDKPLPPPPSVARPEPPRIIPPTVQVVSPASEVVVKEDSLDLKVKVGYSPAQKITGVRILVDGVAIPAAAMRGLRPRQTGAAAPVAAAGPGTAAAQAPRGPQDLVEEFQDFRIAIPPKDCTVAVIAETAMANSELATVKVRYVARVRVDPQGLPKLYILAVGVAKYQDASLNLTFPAKDASDFTTFWQGQKNRLFREVEVTRLTNEQATRDNIMDGLDWLQKQVTQKDLAVAFFAGHGMNDPNTGLFYFLPYNANMDAVKRTMVANVDITTTLDSLAGKRILFLDACHSANVSGHTRIRGLVDINAVRKEMEAAGQGTLVFAAASGRQGAQEDEKWGNGAFTKSVLEALNGQADTRKTGRVTVSMLNAYITERVKELTGGSQTPIFKNQDDLADFPLAILGPIDP